MNPAPTPESPIARPPWLAVIGLVLLAAAIGFGLGLSLDQDALIRARTECQQTKQDNADLRVAVGLPEEAPAVVAVQP